MRTEEMTNNQREELYKLVDKVPKRKFKKAKFILRNIIEEKEDISFEDWLYDLPVDEDFTKEELEEIELLSKDAKNNYYEGKTVSLDKLIEDEKKNKS